MALNSLTGLSKLFAKYLKPKGLAALQQDAGQQLPPAADEEAAVPPAQVMPQLEALNFLEQNPATPKAQEVPISSPQAPSVPAATRMGEKSRAQRQALEKWFKTEFGDAVTPNPYPAGLEGASPDEVRKRVTGEYERLSGGRRTLDAIIKQLEFQPVTGKFGPTKSEERGRALERFLGDIERAERGEGAPLQSQGIGGAAPPPGAPVAPSPLDPAKSLGVELPPAKNLVPIVGEDERDTRVPVDMSLADKVIGEGTRRDEERQKLAFAAAEEIAREVESAEEARQRFIKEFADEEELDKVVAETDAEIAKLKEGRPVTPMDWLTVALLVLGGTPPWVASEIITGRGQREHEIERLEGRRDRAIFGKIGSRRQARSFLAEQDYLTQRAEAERALKAGLQSEKMGFEGQKLTFSALQKKADNLRSQISALQRTRGDLSDKNPGARELQLQQQLDALNDILKFDGGGAEGGEEEEEDEGGDEQGRASLRRRALKPTDQMVNRMFYGNPMGVGGTGV